MLNIGTFESNLQTKLNNTTGSTSPQDFVLLAKSIQSLENSTAILTYPTVASLPAPLDHAGRLVLVTADNILRYSDSTNWVTFLAANSPISALAATTSAQLASVITDETGTGSLVFANTPTLISPNLGNASATTITTTGNVTVGGDLTVNGTITSINSTTVTVDDKNLELGSTGAPSDSLADGGGITLKGTTDKTLNWVLTTAAWTSSENLALVAGKNLLLNGSTSGTATLSAPAVAGSAVITLPAVTGTLATIAGTETLSNKTLTNATINAATIQGHLIPSTTETYDLGSASYRFRDIYLSGNSISLGNATITAIGSTVVLPVGSYISGGGTLVSGTNIDQLATFTKSLTLTTDWQDTGIKNTDLATGTYIVQLYANDLSASGTNINEYYSGTMSWYNGNTDSSVSLPTDEIPLHRAGGSSDAGLYLRTFRSPSGNADALRLQIYSNLANASAANYVFKFRRVI